VTVEAGGEGVETAADGEHEIRRDGDAGDQVLVYERLLLQLLVLRRRERHRPRRPPPRAHLRVLRQPAVASPAPSSKNMPPRQRQRRTSRERAAPRQGPGGMTARGETGYSRRDRERGGAAEGEEGGGGGGGAVVGACRGKRGIRHRHLSLSLSRAACSPRPAAPLFNELPRGAGWLARDVLCFLGSLSSAPSLGRSRLPLWPALSLSASLSAHVPCVSSAPRGRRRGGGGSELDTTRARARRRGWARGSARRPSC
jgi:hypothetical protein